MHLVHPKQNRVRRVCAQAARSWGKRAHPPGEQISVRRPRQNEVTILELQGLSYLA